MLIVRDARVCPKADEELSDSAVIEPTAAEVRDSSCQFEVGEKFASFESFESKLERDKNVVFAEFRKRGWRTILGARKRGVERPINPELKYYEVKYCHVFGSQTGV